MRIFRTLLIAAVNAIKEFLAFATPECFEEGLLINVINNGCTDLGNGIYQGGADHNMVANVGTNIQKASKWEICCRYNNQSASNYPTIFAPADGSYTQNPFLQLVSNKMYLFLKDTNGNDIIQGDTDYTLPSGFHLIQVGWTGTKYYMNVDGDEKWYYNSSVPIKSNQDIMFLNLTNQSTHWGYAMDMSETYITIDNYTTYFYSTIPEVNDNINLNDGMATSNYDWSAYPIGIKNDTYTQTGTVEAIKEVGVNTVYVTQEPQQDNKNVKIQAGEVYYAYININDNTDTLYMTDNPLKNNFTLNNATIVGNLENNAGVFSGFGSGNYLLTQNNFSFNNYFKMIFKMSLPSTISQNNVLFTPEDKQSEFYLQNSSKTICFWLSGTTTQGTNQLLAGNTYWIALEGDIATGNMRWYTDDGSHSYYNLSQVPSFSDTSFWRLENSMSNAVPSQKLLLGYYGNSEYLEGSLDLNNTVFDIDGQTTKFGVLQLSTIYNSSFEEMSSQPSYEIGSGIVASDLQNGAIKIPTAPFTASMEMVIHHRTNDSWPNLCLCSSSENGIDYKSSIYAQNYDGPICLWLCSASYVEGQNADIANDWNTNVYQNKNSEYYFKITWDGSYYRTFISTDGINYEAKSTKQSSTPINWTNNYLYLGNNHLKNVTQPFKNIYLDGTYIKCDGVTIFDGSTAIENIDFTNTGCTLTGFLKSMIKIGNDYYKLDNNKDKVKDIPSLTVDIDAIDNTTIQSVTITTDQTAIIETSANITTSNNDNVITDGSYHLFNITVPTGMTPIIESRGISYQPANMPLLLKSNTGVGFLLKDGNNAYYRNTWKVNRDYDLHYQRINFSYPSGATVTCKVNNVLQNDLTPICYCGDTVSWTCDNVGTITTGTYTVKYSNLDGNIQTITIS